MALQDRAAASGGRTAQSPSAPGSLCASRRGGRTCAGVVRVACRVGALRRIGSGEGSKNYPGFDRAGPDVTLRSSKREGKIGSWGCSANDHRGRNKDRCNRSGVGDQEGERVDGCFVWRPACVCAGYLFSSGSWRWLAGFVVGLLWANLFEYVNSAFGGWKRRVEAAKSSGPPVSYEKAD